MLGTGGMANVYRAYDGLLDTWRAVKVLSPDMTKNRKIRERFLNEARTMARLHHTNIVNVHDVGVDDETVYMVMELLAGGSVSDRVKARGPLPPRMASRVVQAVLEGLGEAHRQSIVHRDIKPHNILVTSEGVPKITDFGIARLGDNDLELTKTGAVIGTWAYMAPEQRADSKGVSPSADIYAAGATLYAIVSGKDPFDLFSAEVHKKAFAGLNEGLCTIIARACRYEPEDRYANCDDMLAALVAAHDALPDNPDNTPPLVMLSQSGPHERPESGGYEPSLDTGPNAGATFDHSAMSAQATAAPAVDSSSVPSAAETLSDSPSLGGPTYGDTTETVGVAKGVALGVAGATTVLGAVGAVVVIALVIGGWLLYKDAISRGQAVPQIVMINGIPAEVAAGEEVPEGAEVVADPTPEVVAEAKKHPIAPKKAAKKKPAPAGGPSRSGKPAAAPTRAVGLPEALEQASHDDPATADTQATSDKGAAAPSDEPTPKDTGPAVADVDPPSDIPSQATIEAPEPWPTSAPGEYSSSVPGQASQLCVYRVPQVVGGGSPTWIYVDNSEVGALRGRRYFCQLLTPGIHEVFVAAPGFKEDYPAVAAGARQSVVVGAGKTWVGEIRLIENGMKSSLTPSSTSELLDNKPVKWLE